MGQGGQASTGGRSHCPYAGSDGQKLRLALCAQGWGSAVQADAVDGPKNRRPCDDQRSVLSPLFVFLKASAASGESCLRVQDWTGNAQPSLPPMLKSDGGWLFMRSLT